MKVTLLNYTPDPDVTLIMAKNTRLSKNAEEFENIKFVATGDWKLEQLKYIADTIPSAWEFVHFNFYIENVSRACLAQFERTRTDSYAEKTLRMNDMSDFNFTYPPSYYTNKNAKKIDYVLKIINAGYKGMVDFDVPAEDARCILPLNVQTNLMWSCNLRSLADRLKSRLGGRTQDEYRKLMKLVANVVLNELPWVELFLFKKDRNYFDDIESFAGTLPVESKNKLLKIVDKMRKDQ